MYFPTSGVEVFPLVPFIVAFGVSFFTSMGGVSGAFLLLPFQVSVLGFASPSVSQTNLVYNIVAIPSGVYRYIKEGRLAWPLAWVIIVGTLPGVFIGAIFRIRYLPDPKNFKFFVRKQRGRVLNIERIQDSRHDPLRPPYVPLALPLLFDN